MSCKTKRVCTRVETIREHTRFVFCDSAVITVVEHVSADVMAPQVGVVRWSDVVDQMPISSRVLSAM